MLGIAAAVALAAAVAFTVTKHTTSKRHDAVAAYITRVNAVQDDMRAQLTLSAAAYRNFTVNGRIDPRSRSRLVLAQTTLRRLERRLAAVPSPPETRRLRSLMRRLATQQTALAGEVVALAAYSPQFAALARSSAAAGKRLQRALGAVNSPTAHAIRGTKSQVTAAQARFRTEAAAAAAAQADAIEAYAAALGSISARLGRLTPPPVLAPTHRTQLHAFTVTRRAAVALATELRTPGRSDVSRFARRFTIAARSAGSVTAQKDQNEAIRAYDRRVRGLATLGAQIRNELRHVQAVVR